MPDTPLNLIINGRFLSQQMTGVQRVAREFVQALDRMMVAGRYPGLRVRMIAQPDADLDGATFAAIEIERIAGGRGHGWEQFTLPRHLGDAALLCLGNTAPIAAMLRRQPVAVILHDLAYRLYPDDYSLAYRLIHRAIDHVSLQRARPLITVSESERRVIAGFDAAAARRIVVAPNGGYAKDLPPDVAWKPLPQPYGLYVGSLSHRKNSEGLIGVAIDLARNAGVRFKFVGPPHAVASSIPDDVRSLIEFCGYVDDAALINLYAGASLMLFPSFYEASGLPPVEAMTIGCPVVVSDIPVLRERCGEAALYCDPRDRQSIYRAALDLIEQPALARRLSELGRAQAARFRWENQVERVIAAIAIEARRGTGGRGAAS